MISSQLKTAGRSDSTPRVLEVFDTGKLTTLAYFRAFSVVGPRL